MLDFHKLLFISLPVDLVRFLSMPITSMILNILRLVRAHVGTWVASCCVKFIQVRHVFFQVSLYLLSVLTRPPNHEKTSLASKTKVLIAGPVLSRAASS